MPGRTKQPRTVGYLVGAIVQLFVGGSWAYSGIANSHVLSVVLGGAIFALGVGAVARYRCLAEDGTDGGLTWRFRSRKRTEMETSPVSDLAQVVATVEADVISAEAQLEQLRRQLRVSSVEADAARSADQFRDSSFARRSWPRTLAALGGFPLGLVTGVIVASAVRWLLSHASLL